MQQPDAKEPNQKSQEMSSAPSSPDCKGRARPPPKRLPAAKKARPFQQQVGGEQGPRELLVGAHRAGACPGASSALLTHNTLELSYFLSVLSLQSDL